MKPPYIKITARCDSHGTFSVERKPNKRTDPCRGREGLYDAVSCPKCHLWATIVSQSLVAVAPDLPGADQTITLPGMGQ